MSKSVTLLLLLLTFGLCLSHSALAATGPVITKVTYAPDPIPAAGGTVTVTAVITDSTSTLSSVVLNEDNRPGYNNPGRSAPMTRTNGDTYKASIPVDLNSNNEAFGESLYIDATDNAGAEASSPAGTQQYSNSSPSISLTSVQPSTIPAAGGSVTVTVQVTDSAFPVSSVTLEEDNRPGYNNPGRVAPMNSGSDNSYTATIQVDQNTSNSSYGESLAVYAVDPAGNSSTFPVGTQQYANKPPTVGSVTFTPDPIPVSGSIVTVKAKATDVAYALSSVVLCEANRPGYNNPGRTAPMTLKDGFYTASIPVDQNTDTGAPGESLYILATDPAGNQTKKSVATQGYSNVPPSGSLPLLSTGDESSPVLDPSSITHGGPDLTLTINGTNFALSGLSVLFNGVTLAPDSVTSTQVSVTLPPSLTATPGSYAVTVVNPSPSGASNSVNFVVN